jgi:peptidoglycan/LPS O-acetylase OafA/YrhL
LDAVSQYTRKVLAVSGLIAAAAAAAGPLWAWGRPDRIWGFALGVAASLLRFAWSAHLARRLERMRPSRYAAARTAGFGVLAAALALAAADGRIDLAATSVGVLVATAAAIAAGFWMTRPAARADNT